MTEEEKKSIENCKELIIDLKNHYEGYELLKAIRDKEIKQGTKIKVSNNLSKLIFDGYTLRWENSLEIAWVDNFTNENITFELIEDEKIDIQKVASIKYNFDKESYTVKDINEAFKTFVKLLGMQSDKINELVQAVKQLDKRTRKE